MILSAIDKEILVNFARKIIKVLKNKLLNEKKAFSFFTFRPSLHLVWNSPGYPSAALPFHNIFPLFPFLYKTLPCPLLSATGFSATGHNIQINF